MRLSAGGDGRLTLSVDYFPGNPIPEPATLGLLALGSLAMLRRRRSWLGEWGDNRDRREHAP